MNNRVDVRDFLTSRRERLAPEQVGLDGGGARRVKGLRRGEVAALAGVSVEYFTRLERGNLTGVSDAVLNALAQALRLDDAERTHLFDLARTANTSGPARRKAATAPRLRPGVRRVLDGITWPAWVRNGRADFIASNALARALYSPVFDDPYRPANTARFAFLNPQAKAFYVDWDQTTNDVVAALHAEAGRNPYDKGLTDLIGELSTRSEDFRTRWAKHNVHFHRSGHKRLHHPVVGTLELSYEAMEFPTEPGLTLLVYTAEPATATADALTLLASWAATTDAEARRTAVGTAREDDGADA